MKDLNYYKNNCEEDYIKTPISVLRYITELEKNNETKQLTLTDVSQQRELLELVTEIANSKQVYSNTRHKLWAKKLISSNCG